jgi:UDP-glucose 4-epimerase
VSILLTGDMEYIGSHAGVVLSQAGYKVMSLDNLFSSNPSALGRLEKILGKALAYIGGDFHNISAITKTLQDCKIDDATHLAGINAVDKSVKRPNEYCTNNVQGALSFIESMQSSNTRELVFNSSATVYDYSQYLVIDEYCFTSATSSYARGKLHSEETLKGATKSDLSRKIILWQHQNCTQSEHISIKKFI